MHTVLLVHVMFTRLYISEYKVNNTEDFRMLILYYENSTFGVIMSWSCRVSYRVTENGHLCFRDTLQAID